MLLALKKWKKLIDVLKGLLVFVQSDWEVRSLCYLNHFCAVFKSVLRLVGTVFTVQVTTLHAEAFVKVAANQGKAW